MAKSYEMDLCSGSLAKKMLLFAIPLILSSNLQLLFNAADTIVVGRFAGSEALAAVGSNGALINLLVNVFMGLSIGTNVLVARYYAAEQFQDLSEVVHTSVALGILCGAGLAAVGFFLAKPALSLMGVPENVLPLSTLYLRIIFLGMPFMLLYNFGSAILRAVGDTRRPLFFLMVAGIANVLLNLLFVIVFEMSVAGVALATIISQAISCILILRCLLKSEGVYYVSWKEVRLTPQKTKEIARLGIPAGLQGALFSVSNVLIQSSINSFGAVAVAANSAAMNLEGFLFSTLNSFHQAAISFTSQNLARHLLDRVKKIRWISIAYVLIIGVVLGLAFYLLRYTLMGIYSTDPQVIELGVVRLEIFAFTYYLNSLQDVQAGFMRGLGKAIAPTGITLICVCGLRIVWIFTVFQQIRTLECLYYSYPVSWMVAAVVDLFATHLLLKKITAAERPAVTAQS